MAITGNARVVEYRKTPGVGNWITLSGEGSGLGDIDLGQQGVIAEVPGEGEITSRKALAIKNASYTMPATKTDKTRAAFGTFKRQRLEFRVHPEGMQAGNPYKQFILYVFARIAAPVNNLQTYALTYTVDGGITDGVN